MGGLILPPSRPGRGDVLHRAFLAIKDEFLAKARTVEGKESIERLSGLWAAEMDEMRAMSRAR